MALFKISRGGYSNLPSILNDGWAYFTPDNKGFYIDVVNEINGQEYNNRIKINDRVALYEYTIETSDWVNKTCSLEAPEGYDDGTYSIEIKVNPVGTIEEQFIVTSAAAQANMQYEFDANDNTIVIICYGAQPTVNIPVKIKFIPSELEV